MDNIVQNFNSICSLQTTFVYDKLTPEECQHLLGRLHEKTLTLENLSHLINPVRHSFILIDGRPTASKS
jgi:hypothetical protein